MHGMCLFACKNQSSTGRVCGPFACTPGIGIGLGVPGDFTTDEVCLTPGGKFFLLVGGTKQITLRQSAFDFLEGSIGGIITLACPVG